MEHPSRGALPPARTFQRRDGSRAKRIHHRGIAWPVQGFSYYPKGNSEASMALRLCATVRKHLADNIMF